jgi:hypothetical protein
VKHPVCEHCVWWCGSVKNGVNASGPFRTEVAGECRALPPSPDPDTGAAIWPTTDADDWCGAHRQNWPMYLQALGDAEEGR